MEGSSEELLLSGSRPDDIFLDVLNSHRLALRWRETWEPFTAATLAYGMGNSQDK